MKTRIVCLAAISLIPLLLWAQVQRAVPGTHPFYRTGLAEVYSGPEANAIYLHLRAGDPAQRPAPAEYTFAQKGEYIISMNEYLPNYSPGDPALPYQELRLALPPDADLSSLQIEVLQVKRSEMRSVGVAPVPPPVLDTDTMGINEFIWEMERWGAGKKIKSGRNQLVYETDALWPADNAILTPGGQMRKWKVTHLEFWPVQYNPVSKRLVLTSEISLKVSFDRIPDFARQERNAALLRDSRFDAQARQLFFNYDQASRWQREILNQTPPLPLPLDFDTEESAGTYAIMTTNDIFENSDQLDEFCFYKKDQGFAVEVITEHSVYEVVESDETYVFSETAGGFADVTAPYPNLQADKIRQWLYDHYLDHDIVYVLLVSNPDPDNFKLGGADDHVGDLPMLLAWRTFSMNQPTDLYFSDLSNESWNLDNDNYVGEHHAYGPNTSIPAGISNDYFSARWEGTLSYDGFPAFNDSHIKVVAEGETSIWLDRDLDGFEADEMLLAYTDDSFADFFYISLPDMSDGDYPIRIDYHQSEGDASCTVYPEWDGDKPYTVKFRHEVSPEVYADGLIASYWDGPDGFAGPADVEQTEEKPDLYYFFGDRDVSSIDFYPEVIVGRIPVYDENNDDLPDYTTLDDILEKMINYDHPEAGRETWRRRVLASAPYMYDNYTTADFRGIEYLMCHHALPPLWDWTRIFDEDYGDELCEEEGEVVVDCNFNATLDEWNEDDTGRGVVMWRTHGWTYGASHVFGDWQCGGLLDDQPSVVLAMTCGNGIPDDPSPPLGYSLLKHGAIATISATRASAGGIFDPADISYTSKNNPYLLYWLARGVFDNAPFGDLLAHSRAKDATDGGWGNLLIYNLYGDPSLSLLGSRPRTSNDVVFVLDGSGSMLLEGKWQAAKDATLLYYQLLSNLRHPSMGDRYGTVVFRWNYGADTDETTVVPPDGTLRDLSETLTTEDFDPYDPVPSYWTPMGAGLQKAVELFDLDSEESFYANKTLLLLSDGKHNAGPAPETVDPPPGADLKVQAVGLGEDDIEPETIAAIAEESGGDYRISPNPREMEDFFVQILCNTSWKLQTLPVDGTTVAIDEPIAVFLVVWDDAGANIGFELDPPGDGPNITPDNCGLVYPEMEVIYHPPLSGETHAFYVCKDIPADLLGDWTFANINDEGLEVPLADVMLRVVEDPRVIADFSIEPDDHFTGQPIALYATVTENGRPMKGLSEVTARLVNAPAVAAGDLMARNQAPQDATARKTVKDLTPRSSYLQAVMKALGMASLNQQPGNLIRLYDNGLNADRKANDGIYTGLYLAPGYEGSYTFAFRVSGENGLGLRFNRSETLSKYVKFRADPDKTKVWVDAAQAASDRKYQTAIHVKPADSYGSYLGPFREDRIRVRSDIGTVGAVTDHRDGSYSYDFRYPRDSRPDLIVTVGEQLVTEAFRVKPVPYPWMFSLHGGVAVPYGNFANLYENGWTAGMDLGYRWTPKLAVVGFLGYNRFPAKDDAVLSDTHWWNLSLNARYLQSVSGPFTVQAQAGPGFYLPQSGSAEWGGNVGIALDYQAASWITLEIGADYHRNFSGADLEFMQVKGGAILQF